MSCRCWGGKECYPKVKHQFFYLFITKYWTFLCSLVKIEDDRLQALLDEIQSMRKFQSWMISVVAMLSDVHSWRCFPDLSSSTCSGTLTPSKYMHVQPLSVAFTSWGLSKEYYYCPLCVIQVLVLWEPLCIAPAFSSCEYLLYKN